MRFGEVWSYLPPRDGEVVPDYPPTLIGKIDPSRGTRTFREGRNMNDLVEFLQARYAEDEGKAQRVDPNQSPTELRAMVTRDDSQSFLVIDSARVLREVEADRKLIAAYLDIQRRKDENAQKFARMMRNPAAHAEDLPAVKTHGWELSGREEGLRFALMVRAERFADHPDYREEWRP